MVDIRSLVVTISAYIDVHEKRELTKKQTNTIIKARKIIIKSLKIIESNDKISPKKMKKIEDRLDKTFNKVISVFPNPEILETILSNKKEK